MKAQHILFTAALLMPGALFGQASPYRGLWVGEIKLDGVNEVSVPLDAGNVPRAPNPAVTTRTFDAANLRLILHVNGAGQVSLLKQVAVLNRKAGPAQSENDIALVTDERLYGSFPPQPAQRIASVVFDFGDSKATAAVDAVVNAAVNAAGGIINSPVPGTQAQAQTAALAAANDAAGSADAAERFAAFLSNVMNSAAVTTLSTSGNATAAQDTAAAALKNGSFFTDTRGENMIAALETAVTGMSGASAAEKKAAAHNVAATYADVDNTYQRFIAGELFGDAVITAAKTAATTAAGLPRKNITAIAGTGGLADITTADHQLITGNRISITGAPIVAYNGVHAVTRINAEHFTLQGVNFVAGKPVTNYAASENLSPVTISSPAHGLTTGTRIVISGAAIAAYNGAWHVTRLTDDAFSIPVAFAGNTGARGVWAVRAGTITGYEAGTGGLTVVKITAPGHGLNNGESIVITGAGVASYNGTHVITRVDADAFTIPVANGGNPGAKGTWSVQNVVAAYGEPLEKTTTVTSTAHGLNTGDQIVITGAGKAAYNSTTFEVERVSANAFIIPVTFAAADGNPAVKGSWAPGSGGSWRFLDPIQTAAGNDARVNDAKTEALRIKLTAYDDTRGTVAINQVVAAIAAAAADAPGTLAGEIGPLAEAAGRAALADLVARSAIPGITPTADYTAFVRADDPRFTDFHEIAPIVAAAAAAGAFEEGANELHTDASVIAKAKERTISSIIAVYAAASRALRPELLLSGGFGPGVTGLTGTIYLPATHPTNPFRHRRHPDHTVGLDITRMLTLNFDGAPTDSLKVGGYGVNTITGTYGEDIKGLHKPLGPNKDIGLKVSGTFTLNRISLIDTLNAR